MDEAEQDAREEVLPFPEVYIKEEPHELQLQDLGEDFDGRIAFEEDNEEEADVDNSNEMADDDEGSRLPDDEDEFEHLQDMEDMTGEDGELQAEPIQGETRCGLCQREYSSAASLKAHLSKKHKLALGPCFTCHLCGAIGQTRATLKRHLLRTHGHSSLSDHQMLKKCQHCGVGYVTLLDLNTHIAEAHAELLAQYHQCPNCPALFRTRHTMLRHIGRRHPDADLPCLEQEKCQECQETFPTRTALRMHIKNHHPEALIHRCSTCSATFKYSYMLRRHVKNIHEKEQQQKEQPPKEKPLYKCCKCPREYRCKTHLQKHYDKTHFSPKQTQAFLCAICNASFATGSRRNRHTRMVHRDRSRPRCSECNQLFETIDEFKLHRQTHKMKCAVCDKEFLRRDTLREHLLIHNGPRHPCPHCPKKFTQSSNLKRHIRIHTGEKPYKCSYCSRRFGDKSACNSHMRVHTGAERCSCPVCGSSFSKRQKLTYHMRKHTGEGLLHCPLCASSTTNSYSLKKHLESHQAVLVGLLQGGTQVASKAEDSHLLAIRTLQNLAWVTVRTGATHQTTPQLPLRTTPPLAEDKVKACEGETLQASSSDCEKGKNVDVDDSEDVMTALQHVEVIVKVENQDEVDELQSLSNNTGERRSSLRQFRKVTRNLDILTESLDMRALHEKIVQEANVKKDILGYTLKLRCDHFNEAVEKLKLEAAIAEERDSLQHQTGNNSWENVEGNTIGKNLPSSEEIEAAESDLSENVSVKKENVDIEMPTDMVSEHTEECSSTLMDEPLGLLARLWQDIIKPKNGPQHSDRNTRLSSCGLKDKSLQGDSDKDTDLDLDLRVQSEPEEKETITCTKESSEVVDSETSECEDGSS